MRHGVGGLALAAAIITVSADHLSGQPARHNPAVQPPGQFDISAPLGSLKSGPQPGVPPFVSPLHGLPRSTKPLVVDPVVQSTAAATAIPSTANNFPGVGNGFSGPAGSFSVNGAPSDANMAVGPNHIVQGVNSSFAVLTKAGAVVTGPTTFASLFSNFGGCQNTNYSDPILQYDRQADRWILSILAFANANTGPYYHCIAVSTGSDPTGSYARYSYSFSNLPDYPKMGVWTDAYYVTYNMFQGNTFVGAQVCAYDRSAMIGGHSALQQCFSTSSADGGLLPGDLDGSRLPPAGSPNYLLSLASIANTLSLWTFSVNWTTPASSAFTGPMNIAVQPYNEACSNGGTCIPQAGTSTQLDSLGDRLMYRLGYRNFGDHEALVANHSVNTGTVTGVRWYEIRSPGSNPTVYQQGSYAPDSNHRWMASIGMDQSGNMALGLSVSGASISPQIHYTGRLATDATLGQMTQGEASIINGGGSQTTYFCFPFSCALTRWGDYSAMRIDPADDCTFWYTNQYIPSNGTFNWSTRIASFRYSSCGSTLMASSTALTVSPPSPSSYGTAVTFTATVTSSSGSGTPTGTVTFLDGSSTLGTGTLNAGVATFTTSRLSAVTHSITASYGGDASFSGSTSSALSYTVAKAVTTTTLSSSTASSTYGGTVTFTATVSPSSATGTVTFLDGTASLGTSALSGGTATLSTSTLAASSTPHSITAAYNGDSNNATSNSSAVAVTITPANTTSAVTSSSPTSTVGQSVTFTATVTSSTTGTPSGTVTFLDGAATLGTAALSGGKATFSTSSLSSGSHQITASYGGDSNFNGSTSAAITQTVNAASGDFSLTASPGNITVRKGSTATYTVTVTPSGGFTGSVALTGASQPSGPTPSFSPASVAGGSGTSTMTVTTGSAAIGSYTLTITGTSGSVSHSTTVSLKVH